MGEPIIGIVGGIGPYAGIDLNRKVFEQTLASRDQQHVSVMLLSLPREIPDRSAFLLGRSDDDPVPGIVKCLKVLDAAGATVAGIACNTAHAPRIMKNVVAMLKADGVGIVIVDMIEAVGTFLKKYVPGVRRVGVLGTDGTIAANAYGTALKKYGIAVVYPDPEVQQTRVHAAIYDPAYGIKAVSDPVTRKARDALLEAATHLARDKGCDALVLGCTEIPLALRERVVCGRPSIDPTTVLARALVERVAPEQLVPVSAILGESTELRSETC